MKRINKETLKQIIIENREFITGIPQPIIEREYFQLPETIKKVVILYGSRRSGKTYLLYHMVKQNPDSSMYIDFEDERLDGFVLEDFETLREAFYELFPDLIHQKVFFLFDEIQIVEGWEKFCRRIVEKSNAEVIAAGSSSSIYPENISTTLRGRCWSIKVFPFSFREFINVKGLKPGPHLAVSANRFQMLKLFTEYMKWGGFPEVITAQNAYEKRRIIKEYLDAIFFKDLVERYDISNLYLLKTLKEKIFSSFSTKFSLTAFYNKLKGTFPFSKDLLYRYYNFLLDAGVAYETKAFSESAYKRARNPAKVYIIDPALSRKTAHDDSARVLENIIFIDLLRRGHKPHYFFHKNECDFVVIKDEGMELIQVTYRIEAHNREREFNGIVEAAKRIGLEEGYILTFDEEDEVIMEGIKIKIVPAWKWMV